MSKLLIILMLGLVSITGYAQQQSPNTAKDKHRPVKHKTHKTNPIPAWAAPQHYDAKEHVYFPDYYTYYDPQRGGYVYWKNGQYSFSPSVPPYLEKVDLSKSRIQILKGLSLDLHPEQNYPNYMKLYPAEHNYDMVPVPTINPHEH